MSLEEARKILPEADFRPPAVRGDIDAVPDGCVVGLIDGRFEQDRSIAPREIHNALLRGVSIIGSSSMGALRSAEVRGMHGVGRVYEMYRDGIIDRDDEVALIFDEERLRALSVPLVNVRHAVENLVGSGTLDRSLGKKLLRVARGLHYSERTYKRILAEAGLLGRKDADQLIQALSSYDLKRNDAHQLLEQMPGFFEKHRQNKPSTTERPLYVHHEYRDHLECIRPAAQLGADEPILIWEYGDSVTFESLLTFLKMTGAFEYHARQAISRFLFHGNTLTVARPSGIARDEALDTDGLFVKIFENWGWRSSEELKVTLRDLGMGYRDLKQCLDEEAAANKALMALALKPNPTFYKALRAQLLLDGLALKRAAFRAGSVAYFAERARAARIRITDSDRRAARSVICWINRAPDVRGLQARLVTQGVDDQTFDRWVDELAHARAAAAGVAATLWDTEHSTIIEPVKLSAALRKSLGLTRSRKAPGSRRFCIPMAEAGQHVKQIAKRVGVTRLGMIGELTRLGVHVSQANRPHARAWSTTSGSGKSGSRVGAVVGGILEESEKFAQENIHYDAVTGSYVKLRRTRRAFDPAKLDLPYDSIYKPNLEIAWATCVDLLSGQRILIPAAAVELKRLTNDIYYSSRGGRKIHTTNGLASGFTSSEALLHALCEYIERHATYIAELHITNPGGIGGANYQFVDVSTLPRPAAAMVRKFARGGYGTQILDITCEVRVPSFIAWLQADESDAAGYAAGYACHPDPTVAVEMALLEAAQTVAGNAAGAREDLTIKARSLGRHERPQPHGAAFRTLSGNDQHPRKSFGDVNGFISNSVLEEVEWVLGCLTAAGVEHVLALELTVPEVRPAFIWRVIIPGLESVNPFHVGSRARVHGMAYLLEPSRFDPI
jgi:ribosomal protein S12 methylthiotransferase accessory factor